MQVAAWAPAEGNGATAVSESRTSTGDGRPLPEHHVYSSIDRAFKANLARLTFGLSPAVLAEQTFDWLVHLAISPGKQVELMEKWFRKGVCLDVYAAQSLSNPDTPPCISPLPHDRRFEGAAWRHWPYNLLYQSFLLTQQWWHNATSGVDGVSQRNEQRVNFMARQVLDMFSPSNFPWTNPDIMQATREQGGRTYQIRTRQPEEHYLDPESWRKETPVRQGSWWAEWQAWLARHSTARVPPPRVGSPEKGCTPRQDAPGSYVRQA